jgi:hypothetical protein
VRKDLSKGIFSEIAVEDAYYPSKRSFKSRKLNTAEQFECIKHLDFVEV